MLDFISSWCGIIGLLVSLLGVFLTWWTLKLAGSIKKAVSEQQEKYVLMIRLPGHIEVLQNALKSFQTLLKADGSIDSVQMQKNIESVQPVLLHIRRSIKRTGNVVITREFEHLEPFIQLAESLQVIRKKSVSRQDSDCYRTTLGLFIGELENFKKDQEARV
ncbi:MAG: hypothetical protein ACRC46_03175 [Thermoguttaceae bacterium]